MKKALISILLFNSSIWAAQLPPPELSACHVFIDYEFIWTLEMIAGAGGHPTPILNIITFADGEWDLRPEQVHLMKSRRREAEIERFSIDTGVPGEPYVVPYMKVQGESFIGIDLKGDFEGFGELKEVAIELGNNRFVLEPVDCLAFEALAQRINQVNFESPDLHQDYEVLKIDLMGKREARRQRY
jgi:hypothetical protein